MIQQLREQFNFAILKIQIVNGENFDYRFKHGVWHKNYVISNFLG